MTDSPTEPTGAPPSDPTPRGPTKCGYVAILGAPNAGKSTLLNRLVGAKLSIVSPKVQTTRTRVLGIQVLDDRQVDTLRSELNGLMKKSHPGNYLFHEYHSNETNDPDPCRQAGASQIKFPYSF